MFLFSLFILLFAHSSFANPNCVSGVLRGGDCQPLRTGMIRLDDQLDAKKPLGSSPFGGMVLVGEDLLVVAHEPDWLAGYDLSKGTYSFWLPLGSPVAGPIEAFEGSVVVGLRTGELLKIDPNKGRVLWRLSLGRYSDRVPVLIGGTLLYQVIDDQMFAIDYASGKKLWLYDADTAASDIKIRQAAAPQVFENKVFMGTSTGEVHILSLAQGNRLKELRFPKGSFRFHDVMGEMVIDQESVVFGRYDGTLARIRYTASDAQLMWKKSFASIAAVKEDQGQLLVGTASGQVIGLDKNSGEQKWILNTPQTIGSFTVVGERVFVAGTEGLVSSIRKSDGGLEWTDDLYSHLDARPLHWQGSIYYLSGYKVLYGFLAKDQETRWAH